MHNIVAPFAIHNVLHNVILGAVFRNCEQLNNVIHNHKNVLLTFSSSCERQKAFPITWGKLVQSKFAKKKRPVCAARRGHRSGPWSVLVAYYLVRLSPILEAPYIRWKCRTHRGGPVNMSDCRQNIAAVKFKIYSRWESVTWGTLYRVLTIITARVA